MLLSIGGLNSFGSQSAAMEVGFSIGHPFLLMYAMQEAQFWVIHGGCFFLCPLEMNKFQFALFRAPLNLKWLTFILAPIDLSAQIFSKSDLGEYSLCLIWGSRNSSYSMELPQTPKTHKNCTISSLRRIFQSERLWEGSLKPPYLGPVGRGGFMTLWFRRSWPKMLG